MDTEIIMFLLWQLLWNCKIDQNFVEKNIQLTVEQFFRDVLWTPSKAEMVFSAGNSNIRWFGTFVGLAVNLIFMSKLIA